MSLEADFRSYLLGQATITAVVDRRVFPQIAPQDADYPLIRYLLQEVEREYTFDGASGLAHARYRVECWDQGDTAYADAKALASATRAVLSGYRGYMRTTYILGVFILREADDIESPPELLAVHVRGVGFDIQISYTEIGDAPEGSWTGVPGAISHAVLGNLDYASSGHTGFLSAAELAVHTSDTDNPHAVTYTQVGAAASDHNHDLAYAAIGHDHDLAYAAIGHDHAGVYSPVGHDHDLVYAAIGHDHAGVYSPVGHDHDLVYAAIAHNHDAAYAAIGHSHTLDALSDVTITAVAAGELLAYTAAGGGGWINQTLAAAGIAAAGHNHDSTYAPLSHTHTSQPASISFMIDGGGAEITTGAKAWVRATFAMTLTGWEITGAPSGSIKIDVWKDTFANFPPTDADSITNGNEPEMTEAVSASGDMTGWSTAAISAGDYIRPNIDTASGVELVVLTFSGLRTIG